MVKFWEPYDQNESPMYVFTGARKHINLVRLPSYMTASLTLAFLTKTLYNFKLFDRDIFTDNEEFFWFNTRRE